MRDDKRNYIVVGAFVIMMLVALILWIALLSGRTGATDDYYIVYDNVMGLKTGVEILYEGFPVGHIEGISPGEREGRRSYRVDVSVKRDWPIPEDSVAEITAPGLLSAYVIDIQAGESRTLLEPGSEIEGREAAGHALRRERGGGRSAEGDRGEREADAREPLGGSARHRGQRRSVHGGAERDRRPDQRHPQPRQRRAGVADPREPGEQHRRVRQR